jgi:hypothetical protein
MQVPPMSFVSFFPVSGFAIYHHSRIKDQMNESNKSWITLHEHFLYFRLSVSDPHWWAEKIGEERIYQ